MNRCWLLPALTVALVACATGAPLDSPPHPAPGGDAAAPRPLASPAPWVALNPGAGGQVQAVVLDPNVNNRAYLLSDVEGTYISNDAGASWVYSGKGLAGTDSLSIGIKPGNSSVLYLGTSVGLHRSTNGGASWTLHPQVNRAGTLGQITDDPNDPGYGPNKMSIGSVIVDSKFRDTVVAGLGGRRWSKVDTATVYRSTDGGASFAKVAFGAANGGNQSVLQLATRPTSGNTVLYAATGDGGLWQSGNFGASGTWGKVPKPADAAERAEGVAVTSDGGTLYAVYKDPSSATNTVIYATRTSSVNWKKLPFGGLSGETANHFITVALDPSFGSANAQRLVAADALDRDGLYELNVTWDSSGNPSATWTKVFYFGQRGGAQDPSLNATFDIGWEGGIFGNRPRPLSYQYTPTAWTKRELWTTGDQTVFKTDRTLANFKDAWKFLYTDGPVQTFGQTTVNVGWTPQNTYNILTNTIFDIPSLGPINTYKGRGSASTVDMDADQYGNVVLSSKADNGVMMSYDGGLSWENVSPARRARSHANLLFKPTSDPNEVYALAHMSYPFDFGAAGSNGELWGRTVNPNSPGPGRWWFLAGGEGEKYNSYGTAPNGDQTLGLPNDIYTNILPDPSNPRRVYVFTKHKGIYRIDDIAFLWCVRINIAACGTNLPTVTKVTDVNSNEYEGSAVIDPNNPSLAYVADDKSLKKVNLATGSYSYLRTSSVDLMSIDVWAQGATTWVAATQDANEVYVSKDGGSSWIKSFSRYDLTSSRVPNFDFSLTQGKLKLSAIEGDGDKMYAVVQVDNPENLGYGVFEISFGANGVKTGITDITQNHFFPKSFRTEVLTDASNGVKYLMMSSWGAGLWRKPL